MKKELKIKKNIEIQQIIEEKNATVGENFIVYKKENHDTTTPRFAISVSKKFGNAVRRNQIKRRIRSIIDESNFKKYDIFVVVRPKLNKIDNFETIKNELNALFVSANLLEEQ